MYSANGWSDADVCHTWLWSLSNIRAGSRFLVGKANHHLPDEEVGLAIRVAL